MNTERNWLIRTTQNQILGPVAKAKVIEFLEKGALGLNDEVASGNGYWFSLKEKDLVEKFLYGDIPQGYNPISESKSVLSRRENPDKTTSLNTAPANKTQILKASSEGPATLPKQEDLEYPDITLIQSSVLNASSSAPADVHEDMILPNSEDLEFPDITLVARPQANSYHSAHDGVQTHSAQAVHVEVKKAAVVEQPASPSDGPVVYPKEDDLEFPDLMSSSAIVAPIEEDLDFKVNLPDAQKETKTIAATAASTASAAESKTEEPKPVKKSGMINFKNETDNNSNLTLIFDSSSHDKPKADMHQAEKQERAETSPSPKKSPGLSLAQKVDHQPEKLLHERKVKSSSQKDITKDLPKQLQERVMPEELKKRNDNYLLYLLIIIVLIILALFFYYYRNILNKPLPV